MKTKPIERQLRQVLDGRPISVVGSLAYLQPLDYLLRGFKVETSGFSADRLTVECFVMPLFPGQDYLAFMIGGRLGQIGGGQEKWWTVDLGNPTPTFDEIAGLMLAE